MLFGQSVYFLNYKIPYFCLNYINIILYQISNQICIKIIYDRTQLTEPSMFAIYLPCDEEEVVLRVEHGPGEVGDEQLQPPEVLPGAQVVELLLQLVNLAFQVRHLEAEHM